MPTSVTFRWSLQVVITLAWGAVAAQPVPADESGVYSDRIVLGQSAALEGPAAQLGRDFSLGLEVAFAAANQAGGVHGRRLQLVSLDDGYEPTRAIANTHQLLDEHRVFALIGEVGTPTARAVVPIAEERQVPFLAPFSGAEFLRDPGLRSVINLRAAYLQETEVGVGHLVGELGLRRVAVLFQDDTFGRDGLEGVRRALRRRGLEPVADATYKRNTTAVKRAALDLRAAEPDAVFIIGAYAPAAEFITTAQRIGFRPQFISISFVGSVALATELGPAGEGVLVTQVVPPFEDGSRQVVREFRERLTAHSADAIPSFVVLEGYVAGRLTVKALERLGADPTRQAFLELVRSGELAELDGIPLKFGTDDNQGWDEVFLTRLDGRGSIVEVKP